MYKQKMDAKGSVYSMCSVYSMYTVCTVYSMYTVFSREERFKNGGYCGQVAEATAVICAPSAKKIMAELRKERKAMLDKIASYHRHIDECTSEMSEY